MVSASAAPIGVVDLGGTKLYSAILDSTARVLGEDLCDTEAASGVSSVLNRIVASLTRAARDAGVDCNNLYRVGVAAPGPVETARGHIIDPPNLPGWGDVALGPLLSERLGLPVAVENDANAAAYGEYVAGAGRGARALIYVTVSTGIGGGIVLDGVLYRGPDGAAGEIGHMVVLAGGPACGCGRRGCLEAVASGTAIARDGRNAIERGQAMILRRLAAAANDEVSAEMVAEAAAAGDGDAAGILLRAAEMLGIGLGNLVNIFNPDVIVLGGGVTNIGKALLQPAEVMMRRVAFAVPGRLVNLRRAELDYPAIQGLAGALRAF
jgi:glucokinase